MSAIRMKTLVDAHAALTLVQAAIEALPGNAVPYGVWDAVMKSRIALGVELQMMAPVPVSGVPNEQA